MKSLKQTALTLTGSSGCEAAAAAAAPAGAADAEVAAAPEPVDVTGHTWHSPALEELEPRRETPWLLLQPNEVWQCVLSVRSPSPQSLFCLRQGTRYGVSALKGTLWMVNIRGILPSLSTGAASGWLDLAIV